MINLSSGSTATALLLSTSAWAGDVPTLFDTPWVGFDAGTYNTARYFYAATVADFNGDGFPDVAAVTWPHLPRVSVLLNNGPPEAGTYAQPMLYTLPGGSYEVIAADVDHDGDQDIVAAITKFEWDGTAVAMLRNHGDGTFAPAQSFACGTAPVGLAAADFTGDGLLDLAVANWGFTTSTISLLANNGAGGFSAPEFFPAGDSPFRLAAADFNNDGGPDLVVSNAFSPTPTAEINVLYNDLAGGFEAPVTIDPPGGAAVFVPTVAAADIDLDGDSDILFSHTGQGGMVIVENTGGTFESPLHVSGGLFGGGVVSIAVADVTNDGWPDLIGTNLENHGWSLFPALGNGEFGAAIRLPSGEQPIDAEVADVDGDGDVDVLVLNRDSLNLNVHINRDGDFQFPARYHAEAFAAWLDAGDIDSDGDLDLVAASSNIDVLRNAGDGIFSGEHITVTGPDLGDTKLRDLDSDGDLDLLWIQDDPPYSYAFKLNNGGGSFGPAVAAEFGTCGNFKAAIEAADFDVDGDLDIVLIENLGCFGEPDSGKRLFVVENLGGAAFQLFDIVTVNIFPISLVTGDFNEDGVIDLALTGRPTDILLSNGDLTFTQLDAADMPGIFIDTADLNGDGHLDLAVGIQRNVVPWLESMAVMMGDGDGTFGPADVYLGSHAPDLAQIQAIKCGDVDGDGDNDVMASNYASGDASVWLNDGDGTFQPHIRYGLGHGAKDIAYADFTGDGVADLAVLTGSVVPSTPGVTLLAGTAVPSTAPADLDGDGSVGFGDLLILLANWGDCPPPPAECAADLDGSGGVGFGDLLMLLTQWG